MRAKDIRAKAGEGPLTMLTAYDAPTAELVDEAGVDMVLVGDSVGNTRLGYDSTLPVTVEEMASHTAAVARATDDALVIADMPFLSYGADEGDAVENCGRMLKEADADAVKLECGPHTVELTRRLIRLGIPVQAHLGLTPQRENETGLFRQGTDEESAREILDLAREHERAGAFSLVLEHVPANLARAVTEDISIPTIGIGAGPPLRRPGARHRRGHRPLGGHRALLEGLRRRPRRDARGHRIVRRGRRRRGIPRLGTQSLRGGAGRHLLMRVEVERAFRGAEFPAVTDKSGSPRGFRSP